MLRKKKRGIKRRYGDTQNIEQLNSELMFIS